MPDVRTCEQCGTPLGSDAAGGLCPACALEGTLRQGNDAHAAAARYTPISLHAVGGIGRVWLAHDNQLARPVALKEIRPDRTGNTSVCARFLREAQITGKLEHPGIIPVYELANRSDNQQPYYVMRFIKGRTLNQAAKAYHENRLQNQANSLDFFALLNAFISVCNTIAYAHSAGIIHRDLKGHNVVLGDFGEVIVLDWGLAKVVKGGAGEEDNRLSGAIPSGLSLDDTQLTTDGEVLGTPTYMAPEQAMGRLDKIDHRTDIYGLGSMLYHILSGRAPFSGSDPREVLRKVCEEDPLPLHDLWPDVPEDLESLCLRALAKDSRHRPASASEMAQAVQSWQETVRKRAEQAHRESEAFYHSLVESLPQSILRKDLEGRFTYANQGACRDLGRRLDEILGKTDYDVCPRELADKYRFDDRCVLQTGKLMEVVEEHQTLSGPVKYVHTIKTPVYDSTGAPVGTQVIYWDVSDRKRLEEALKRTMDELASVRRQLTQANLAQEES